MGLLVGLIGGGQLFVQPVAAAAALHVSAPANVSTDATFALTFQLPASTAAFQGRVLVDSSAAEVVGVAPVSGGVGSAAEETTGGYTVAAYGLPTGRAKTMQVVLSATASGTVDMRLVIDATADRLGHRIQSGSAAAFVTVRAGSGGAAFMRPI